MWSFISCPPPATPPRSTRVQTASVGGLPHSHCRSGLAVSLQVQEVVVGTEEVVSTSRATKK